MNRPIDKLAGAQNDEVHALIPLDLSASGGSKAQETAKDKLKQRVVFIKKAGAGDIWASTTARNSLFTRITTDTFGSLSDHKVIKIETLGPDGSVIYSYTDHEGTKVYRTIEREAEASLTSYKVQTLSLPVLRQSEVASAIPTLLKGCLDLLKMPFTYLQSKIKGPSQAQKFAHALIPPEHDKVGEKNHEDVLFQLGFVSRFFSTGNSKLTEELSEKVKPSYSYQFELFGELRPAKQTERHYEILLSSHDLSEKDLKWLPRREDKSYTWTFNQSELKDIEVRVFRSGKPEWKRVSQLAPEELPFTIKEKDHEITQYSGGKVAKKETVKKWELSLKKASEGASFSTWIRLPKKSPLSENSVGGLMVDSASSLNQPVPPNGSQFFTAGQRMSFLFAEASRLGLQMYSAHQSQNRHRVDDCIDSLTIALANLNERKPPYNGHFIIPVALGEGKDYLPHFLVFETKNIGGEKKTFVKHICITSTARETKQVQFIKTYDVSRLKGTKACRSFATRLMHLQPYKRKKDALENLQAGPTSDDLSLDQLLLKSGTLLTEQTTECKPSRDPIKLMFHLANQLNFSPNENSGLDSSWEELRSKAFFYKTYVDHIVSYYQKVESSLSAQDKERALMGIRHYAEKVSHYMEKELGVEEALSIAKPLSDFVEKKLELYHNRAQLEKADLERLNLKAKLFTSKLEDPLSDKNLKRSDKHVVVEGSRVNHKQWLLVQKMAKKLREPSISDEDGTTTFQKQTIKGNFTSLLEFAEGLLRSGETRAAKTLLVAMLEALVIPQPEAGPNTASKITFWDTLNSDELLVWQKQLYLLAEKTMEASLRSGQYPLVPREAFDFNVVLPLIQRYLLHRRLPLMEEKLLKDLRTKMKKEGVAKKLQENRIHFLNQRDREIEAAVRAKLRVEWEKQDAKDREDEARYISKLVGYKANTLAYEANLLLPEKWRAHLDPPGPEPIKPDIKTPEVKAKERADEEAKEIKTAKENDSYRKALVQLKKEIPQFKKTGAFVRCFNTYSDFPRCQAVMGSFLKIIGVDKASVGYLFRQATSISQTLVKSENQTAPIPGTFARHIPREFAQLIPGQPYAMQPQLNIQASLQAWLMAGDHSLLIGTTPEWEKRYHECKQALTLLYHNHNPYSEEYHSKNAKEKTQTVNLIVGYQGLGDGTQLLPTGDGFVQKAMVLAEASIFQRTMDLAIQGYFEGSNGDDFFVPEEVSLIRKADEMRKLLARPEQLINKSTGFLAKLVNGEKPKSALAREALAKQKEIHLVSKVEKQAGVLPTGVFTLSTNPDQEGALVLNSAKEGPATTDLRDKSIGELKVRTVDTNFDRETSAVDQVRLQSEFSDDYGDEDGASSKSQSFKKQHLDQVQEVVLWASSMGIDTKSPSYLAVQQCFHFIYQYPEKVASNAVRDFLLKTIFQEGLIQKLLKNNPGFFIENKKFFFDLITLLKSKAKEKPAGKNKISGGDAKKQRLGDDAIDPEEYSITEIWVRDIYDRILTHAKAIYTPDGDQVSEELKAANREIFNALAHSLPSALPTSSKSKKGEGPKKNPIVVDYYQSHLSSKKQKAYATYVLSYYSRNIPKVSNDHSQDWINILNAYYLMNKSPFVGVHSGLEQEVHQAFLSTMLPKVEAKLHSDLSFRSTLLSSLTGKSGDFTSKNNTPYLYLLPMPNGESFEVDLRTGKGFSIRIETGDRGYLPFEVLTDSKFITLFEDCGRGFSPFVKSEIAENGIIDFSFSLEKDGTHYRVRFNRFTKECDISQICSGKEYLYATPKLKNSKIDQILSFLGKGSRNQTVEKLIHEQGIWVPLDENRKPQTAAVLLAQYGRDLEKDPITLHIQNEKIKKATTGKGKDLKYICSSLRNQKVPLLSFCSPSGLLLLSKDGVHIDEIRFPKYKSEDGGDINDDEQLILVRDPNRFNVWTLKDQSNWVLELTDTGEHEKRFGKHWREYVCPLKNAQSGDYEYWIFPHAILKKGKRGTTPKFLKSATDLLQSVGATLNHMGLSVPGKSLGLLAGVTHTLEGQFGGVDDLGNALVGSKFRALGQLGGLINKMTDVAPARYRVGDTTSCSHMGFLYLANQAASRGEWGSAAHYLDLTLKHGYSNKKDALALRNFLARSTLVDTLLGGDAKDIFERLQASNTGPLEAAYRAKRAVILLQLKEQLSASYHIEIFQAANFVELLANFREGASSQDMIQKLLSTDKIFGASLIFQMGSALKNYSQGMNEASSRRMLEDLGLVIPPADISKLERDYQLVQGLLEQFTEKANEVLGKKPLEGNPAPVVALPPLVLPLQEELEFLAESVSNNIASYGAWSIDDLHKTQGAYPKRGTVVSHFWDYMLWIYKNNLSYDQVAFLSKPLVDVEIGSGTDLVEGLIKTGKQVFEQVGGEDAQREHEPVDIARRTLLAWWKYCKNIPVDERNKQSVVMEQELKAILRLRETLPDFAAMNQKASSYEASALLKPGLINSAKAFFYPFLIKGRIAASQVEANVYIGNVPHQRGPASDFNQMQRAFLIEHMLPVLRKNLKDRILDPSDLITREGNELLIVRNLTPAQQDSLYEFLNSNELKPIAPAIQGLMADQTRMADFEQRWLQFLQSFRSDSTKVWNKQLVPVLIALADRTASEDRAFAIQKNTFCQSIRDQQIAGLAHDIGYRYASSHLFKSSKKEFSAPRPSQVAPRYREQVTINPSIIPDLWTAHFIKIDSSKVWEKRAGQVTRYFDVEKGKDDREKNKLKGRGAAVEKVKNDLISRTNNSFVAKDLGVVRRQIDNSVDTLKAKQSDLQERILDFTRRHARDLGLLQMFSDRNRFSEEQLIQKILDIYQEGQLGLLGIEELQNSYAQQITDYLLVSTEIQQYEKAKQTCKALDKVLKKAKKQTETRLSEERFWTSVQHKLDRSVDWILNSAELRRQLTEGNNYLRHAEEKDGQYRFKDQQFDRRFLVTEIRNKWISRRIAIDSLQQLVNELREGDKAGKPARFFLAKMGTGKTFFIFKKAIELLIANGKEPVMITNDELLDQMAGALGKENVFLFYFDINFGLKAPNMTNMSEQEKKDYYSEVATHLKDMHSALQGLKKSKKVVLTSPSQYSSVRNKRIQLQDLLKHTQGEERSILFGLLQQVKLIETYFCGDDIVKLVDEDINFDISMEYNYATGNYRKVNEIRLDAAEKLLRTAQSTNPNLWSHIVENDLRAIQDVAGEFTPVLKALFADTKFWASLGWKEEEWNKINKTSLISYVLGKRSTLPKHMPLIEENMTAVQKRPMAYIGALKTLMKAFSSVAHVNPKLERGLGPDQVSVIPYDDGEPKENIVYGEESEILFHILFHYMGTKNKIGEEIFWENYKALKVSDSKISPHFPEAWENWAGRIGAITSLKSYNDEFEAFQNAPELSLERLQYVRYLLQKDYVKVYHEQISFNSQDIGVGGEDVRVGSGTGSSFNLNLADVENPDATDDQSILVETLMCMDLDRETSQMSSTPLHHIEAKAKDPSCVAILNFDYEVMNGNAEKLVSHLRQNAQKEGTPARDFIYRDLKNKKKIWKSEALFPIDYDPTAIDPDKAFFIYLRKDSRGVHFDVPRGGNRYAEAMVGCKNKEDPIAQLVWRQRHLDLGHSVRYTYDANTAKHVRDMNGLEEANSIQEGHLWYYFFKNTLAHDDVMSLKALNFSLHKPFKTLVDEIVRTPYDLDTEMDPDGGMSDILETFQEMHGPTTSKTKLLEAFEGMVLMPAIRDLYILDSSINWAREYQPTKQVDIVEYAKEQCRREESQLEAMQEEFEKRLHRLLNHEPSLELCRQGYQHFRPQLTAQTDLKAFFNTNLYEVAPEMPARQRLINLGILGKALGLRHAFLASKERIKNEQARLETETYKKFLYNNLKPTAALDADSKQRNEQQVQQQVQQEQEVEQQQTEQQLRASYYTEPTEPLEVSDFIRFTERRVDGYWIDDVHRLFRANRALLPVRTAFPFENSYARDLESSQLPNTLFNDHVCISHRAYALLEKMQENGVPLVEILVFEKEILQGKESEFYSIIVAPSEREQRIADFFNTERARQTGIKLGVYALSNEKFPQLLMDKGASKPNETHPEFVSLMIRNKLLLNWQQFSLEELDALYPMLEGLSFSQLAQLRSSLEYAGSKAMANRVGRLVSEDNPDLEWELKVAKRKLCDGRGFESFRKAEKTALKAWITTYLTTDSQRETIRDELIQYLPKKKREQVRANFDDVVVTLRGEIDEEIQQEKGPQGDFDYIDLDTPGEPVDLVQGEDGEYEPQ